MVHFYMGCTDWMVRLLDLVLIVVTAHNRPFWGFGMVGTVSANHQSPVHCCEFAPTVRFAKWFRGFAAAPICPPVQSTHPRWLSNCRAPRPGVDGWPLYNGTGRVYAGRGRRTSAAPGLARSDPCFRLFFESIVIVGCVLRVFVLCNGGGMF
uniref:(northern house mosquito) hypothetical protein n=1 Tax=Culex pipiens TaxID=7175 RepID=A0A8D8N618_CULPI